MSCGDNQPRRQCPLLQALSKKAVALNAVLMAEKEAAMLTSGELIGKASAFLADGVVDNSYRDNDVTDSKKALDKVLAIMSKLS